MRFTLPLLVFSVVVFLLAIGLRMDPTIVPSVLIGKPVPEFSGSTLADAQQQITQQDLIGKPAILSFWATWCAPCLEEHSFLMELAEQNDFPIYGINYKDDRQAANEWIQSEGNPYDISIYDGDGRIGMEWGVYAVPELFVLDSEGIIYHRFLWPVDKKQLQESVLSLISPLTSEET